MDKQSPILVVGAGSVGERHIQNLLRAGYSNIHVLRRAVGPMRQVDAHLINMHVDREAVKHCVCAIICNPTAMHAETAHWCLSQGMHVLVEKPLSHTLENLQELQLQARQHNLIVQVAYMMRYHPHVLAVASAIQDMRYGSLVHMETYWGSYLPDWHPWEDHRNSYVALKNLGGGVALTLSHDLDLVNWLAGAPIQSCARKYAYTAALEIETESIADFDVQYKNGISAHVHMNLLDKPQKRTYQFQFEHAQITLDFFAAEMRIETKDGTQIDTIVDFDRNTLFVDELHDFLHRINRNENHDQFTTQQINDSITLIEMCV